MHHPVVWFEVTGKNGERLQSFYSELFGWKVDANNPMKYGMVDTGTKEGIPGGIGNAEGNQGSRVTFYVQAKDPQAALTRAERLGAKVVMPVTELPDVTIALLADPEGNVIGLLKQKG